MSIRRHFLILDHQDNNFVGKFELGDSVIFIPGELENSTLGIGAAGDHVDVLKRVYLLFCLQTCPFSCFKWNVSSSFQEFGQICKLQRWRETFNVAPITKPTWQCAMREIPECSNQQDHRYQLCSPGMFCSSAPGVPVGSRQQQWPWRQEPASPRSSSG